MKDKKIFGIISLVLAILSLAVPMFWLPNSLSGATTFVAIFILLAVCSVVLGFLGKNDAKGLSIAGIIIGIIGTIILLLTIVGLAAFKSVKDCVKTNDETAQCDYLGQKMDVPTQYLNEDQYKKDE